jgi:tetratricopeptide (TPR) repeat protein
MSPRNLNGWTDDDGEFDAAARYLSRIGPSGSDTIAQEPVRRAGPDPGPAVPFDREGLDLLANKDFKAAAVFYEPIVKNRPDSAEGWFGLAVIYFGTRDYKRSALCIKKMLDLIPTYPMTKEIAQLDPINCESFFGVGRELFALQLYQLCVEFLDECLKCQVTPQKIYMKADALRKRARKARELETLKSRGSLGDVTKTSQSVEKLQIFFKVISILAFLGAAVGGYLLYCSLGADYYFNKGLKKYLQGYQGIQESESGRDQTSDGVDPTEHLKEALQYFRKSVEIRKDYTLGHHMLLRTGNLIVRVEGKKSHLDKPYDQALLKECSDMVAEEKKIVKALDPTGAENERLKRKIQDELAQ